MKIISQASGLILTSSGLNRTNLLYVILNSDFFLFNSTWNSFVFIPLTLSPKGKKYFKL